MSKQAVQGDGKPTDSNPTDGKLNGSKDNVNPTDKPENASDTKSNGKPQPPKGDGQKSGKITYVNNKNITLTEDVFGLFYNEKGRPEKIYRYTWSNHNQIEVEVITYGARIRSIKMPNKRGTVDDIVLGYQDLAGCIYYKGLPFGATLGRVASYIENSTFVIDGKQYWVSSNCGKHQYNGGVSGFDQVIFTPYVDGTKVILSHTSPDLTEGYPGSLLVRITFELTPKNEFTVNMEALTTKPTLVNLSNLLYFNLAGHQSGPEEIYKHTVTVNANCYTIYNERKLPSGDLQNVVNTPFDFQIPTILKSCMGLKPEDGFDQNLCVNRGIEQGVCFVARALHVPSGRILEVYSNQCGVNFTTGNDFGSGLLPCPVTPKQSKTDSTKTSDDVFHLLDDIYNLMLQQEQDTEPDNEEKMRKLLERLSNCKFNLEPVTSKEVFQLDSDVGEVTYDLPDFNINHMLTALELNYLVAIKDIAQKAVRNVSGMDLQTAVNEIVALAQKFDNDEESTLSGSRNALEIYRRIINGSSESISTKSGKSPTKKGGKSKSNVIPRAYKDGRIHGKNDAIYKRHGGIAFQTQNYPNAIYHPNFPNSILRPGEIYKHTIVYKFFVQSGNAAKWMKRQQCC